MSHEKHKKIKPPKKKMNILKHKRSPKYFKTLVDLFIYCENIFLNKIILIYIMLLFGNNIFLL